MNIRQFYVVRMSRSLNLTEIPCYFEYGNMVKIHNSIKCSISTSDCY